MSDRETPLTDKLTATWANADPARARDTVTDSHRDLERKLSEARVALEWARGNLGKHTRPSPIDKALARIDGND